MTPYTAEFFGTMIMILLGEGVVAGVLLRDSKAESAGWLTIVVAWGLAVTLAIYAVGRISNAHLNPAITIALWATGDFESKYVLGYILAQFAGAFAGAVLVWLQYLPHWGVTDNPATKLAVFSCAPAIRATLPN